MLYQLSTLEKCIHFLLTIYIYICIYIYSKRNFSILGNIHSTCPRSYRFFRSKIDWTRYLSKKIDILDRKVTVSNSLWIILLARLFFSEENLELIWLVTKEVFQKRSHVLQMYANILQILTNVKLKLNPLSANPTKWSNTLK